MQSVQELDEDPLQVSAQPSMHEPEQPLSHALRHEKEHPEHELDSEEPVQDSQHPDAHWAVQSEQAESFLHDVKTGRFPLNATNPIRGNTVFEVCLKNSLLVYKFLSFFMQ